MQIVWDQEVIEKLKGSHTVLELETFEVDGKPLTAYCVVPAEKLFNDMSQLDSLTSLHAGFVQAFNQKNYQLCCDAVEHLKGKFGGELDTFYDCIIEKINNESNSN
jgi:hypothetical protein